LKPPFPVNLKSAECQQVIKAEYFTEPWNSYEFFASVRSGASIEATIQSQPPRFPIPPEGRSHDEETKRDPWAAEAARLDP
jgi:hypothetical protein